MGLRSALGSIGNGALSVAFPAACAGCDGIVEDDPRYPHLCDRCADKIHIIQEPRCMTCGYPFFGVTESAETCPHCDHLDSEFGRGWSIALFRGPVRDLVYALKYKKGFWALDDMAEIARNAPGLRDYTRDAILVPVPLHPRKFRERGYNQSELIADSLSAALPSMGIERLVRRHVDTPSQTRFNRRERNRNLKNAFSLKGKRAIDPLQRYLIIDDVFTTGSTLNACASVLRAAGAKKVDALSVGHG